MRRLFCLLGVVLSIIFSTPFTISTIINISANDYISYASTAQEDLKSFGLSEDDYSLDLDSNRHVSCFLFVEDIEEDTTFYYLYLYDPKAFSVVPARNYLQIQISHLTSNFIELLDDDSAVERSLNYYDLTYMSSSDNGTVAKFLVNGLKFSSPKIYRRYQLRQISYFYDLSTNFYTFGDEFLYETLNNGSVTYQWKKMDYITLYNVILDSYIIDVSLNNFDKLVSFLGGEYYLGKYDFYGFSLPKDLDITDLISIDFSYYKSDYIFYKPGTDFDKADIYVYEDTSILNGRKYMRGGRDSDYEPLKINREYYPDVKINDYEIITNIDNKWFCSQKFKLNTISTYKELSEISNNDMRNGLMNTFKDCDYVINFAGDPCYSESGTFAYAINSDKDDYDPFVYALDYHNKNIASIYNGGYFTYSKYTTSYYSDVEAVKLTLNSDGKLYDLDVIVSPQDSPDNPNGTNPNPTIWDKLLELFYKFRDLLMETFGLDEIWATLLAIVLILVSLFIIFDLVKSLVVKGSTSLILKVGSITFTGLGYLFKGLFTILYYLLIYPFKLIFGG